MTTALNCYILFIDKYMLSKGVFNMDMLPGALRVLIDWLIMIMGTLFTFLEKKEETPEETVTE